MFTTDYLKTKKKQRKNSLVISLFKQNHCRHVYKKSFSLFFYASTYVPVCLCVYVCDTYILKNGILTLALDLDFSHISNIS